MAKTPPSIFSTGAAKLAASLHVYAGLFVAPAAVLFSLSVLVINHATARAPGEAVREERGRVEIPAGVEALPGRERIDRLRPLLDGLGVRGEVGWIRHQAKEGLMSIPVTTASREWLVELNLGDRSAMVTTRPVSLLRGTAYLHKMPGQHLVAIRGNWVGTRIWKVLADWTVYLVLLATVTGIWLWWLLRPLRRTGLVWLAAGTVVVAGVIYALVG